MKILIVEDERRLGQFIKKGLMERSYTATWVPNCRTARDALCETGYDVIILDLGLPDGDGLALGLSERETDAEGVWAAGART